MLSQKPRVACGWWGSWLSLPGTPRPPPAPRQEPLPPHWNGVRLVLQRAWEQSLGVPAPQAGPCSPAGDLCNRTLSDGRVWLPCRHRSWGLGGGPRRDSWRKGEGQPKRTEGLTRASVSSHQARAAGLCPLPSLGPPAAPHALFVAHGPPPVLADPSVPPTAGPLHPQFPCLGYLHSVLASGLWLVGPLGALRSSGKPSRPPAASHSVGPPQGSHRNGCTYT